MFDDSSYTSSEHSRQQHKQQHKQQLQRFEMAASPFKDYPYRNDDNDNDNYNLHDVDGRSSSSSANRHTHNNNNNNNRPNPWFIIFLLNIVAVLWGTQHPVIKLVVDDNPTDTFDFDEESVRDNTTSPALSVLLRFGIAAILASPATPLAIFHRNNNNNNNNRQQQQNTIHQINKHRKLWKWGLELGFWLFCGFAMNSIALTWTTAQRAGFLLYLNVKFVPLLAWLLGGKRISATVWISAIIAVIGTCLLMLGNQEVAPFNVGDVIAIGSAITSAMFIWRLEVASKDLEQEQEETTVGNRESSSSSSSSSRISWNSPAKATAADGVMKRNSKNYTYNQSNDYYYNDSPSFAASLHATTMWGTTLGCLLWTLVAQLTTTAENANYIADTFPHLFQDHFWGILYLAIVPTALCNYIQTYAQRYVASERATLIYSMDPVYGAIVSYFVLGETLGKLGYVGAMLIFLASTVVVTSPKCMASVNRYYSSSSSFSSSSKYDAVKQQEEGDENDSDFGGSSSSFGSNLSKKERRTSRRQSQRDEAFYRALYEEQYQDENEITSETSTLTTDNILTRWNIGIALAIISVIVNIYVVAEVVIQQSLAEKWFIAFAASFAALVSLVVALREMIMLLDGTEDDARARLQIFRGWAIDDNAERIRLSKILERATYREFCTREAQERLKNLLTKEIGSGGDGDNDNEKNMNKLRQKVANLTTLQKDIQSDLEMEARQILLEELVKHALANDLPLMRSLSSEEEDEDDPTIWVLTHLEQTRPDVVIHRGVLTKERTRYASKMANSKFKHDHATKPRTRVGVFLLVVKDLSLSPYKSSSDMRKKRKRILDVPL